MAVATDTLSDAKQTEKYGVNSAATRTFFIDVTIAGQSPDGVFTTALADTSVPTASAAYSATDSSLRCAVRDCSIVGNDGTIATVKVICTYERREGELAGGETHPTWFRPLRGSSTVSQVTTQVYGPGDGDLDGQKIVLEYGPDGENKNKKRAEVTVLDIQQTFQREITIQTADIEAEIKKYVNHVNADVFRGDPARSWLVVYMDYKRTGIVDATICRYDTVVEFQYSDCGHVYTAVWYDEDGFIPEDANKFKNMGTVDVKWHDTASFPAAFGK